MYTHLDGPHSRVPMGALKIDTIAQLRKPRLTNSVLGDELVNQEWARQEGMKAFAGYPLLVENRVLGVMAMFSRQALSEAALDAMSSVSNGIALGVERLRAGDALRASEERYRMTTESASDGIIIIDAASRIHFLNSAAARMFGYAPEELLQQPLTLVIPAELRHRHREAIARYLETGRKTMSWNGIELPGLRKDGQSIALEVSFGQQNLDGHMSSKNSESSNWST